MTERGVVINRRRATQVRDFSGLRYGAITPTDIDALIDFGGKAYVLIEVKHAGTKLPYGQRLAIERVVDCLALNSLSLALIAEHDIGPDEDIDVGACVVVEYRARGLWLQPRSVLSVRETVDRFLRAQGLGFYRAGACT